ncbi:MAG: L,D-transpeptidase family protein [Rickettsiales bacterium]
MYNISKRNTLIYFLLLTINVYGYDSIAADSVDKDRGNISGDNEQSVEKIADEKSENDSVVYVKYIEPLQEVRNKYEKIKADGGWASFKLGKTIKPQMSDSRIPTIRSILSVMGDYKKEESKEDEETDTEQSEDVFDKRLVEAVKEFQKRHGLEIDGMIGKNTQAAMLVPVEFRIAQIEATLKRMQEMKELGGRYILVNIAGYYLSAVEDGEDIIKSKVIVGDVKNNTPIFNNKINHVSFNPPWYVPKSIASEEIMAKIKENPDFLTDGNYVVTDVYGDVIENQDIDAEVESGDYYRFKQLPGKGNTLGKVKFNVPNNHNIYLHSTKYPQLFNKTNRALSHGCIRVEKPKELTHFIMKGRSGWDSSRIDKTYDSDESKIVMIKEVPVHAVYWTAWVDEKSGKPYFYPDIYELEKDNINRIVRENKIADK